VRQHHEALIPPQFPNLSYKTCYHPALAGSCGHSCDRIAFFVLVEEVEQTFDRMFLVTTKAHLSSTADINREDRTNNSLLLVEYVLLKLLRILYKTLGRYVLVMSKVLS
jgi:hypothetical protein